ncbi:pentatricopeptide repeat-containing protein At1g03100, mitochondrial [Cicer arietinum]|uniref:Pentatricopeptide repeat-containing protein At1g03100, mitochondrial n=1 Tax=Cicer arietinum TaxID=3827 RepID=A0A1S2YIS7_CICAR|nr:pentatricopeptide repeat-containing protein At1g03100, mitochondrial [Cicer arietinum]XP_004505420.1 pentatricopeptide repeat-containing protein At1g03100, mitochondrial [Cicer arietinum]XP_012572631.1 pentatricopeptide repeat-containing protein At1g03100, mitochondrial [Cicer arietinum]
MLAIRRLKTGPDLPYVLCFMIANCNYGTAQVSNNRNLQSIVKFVSPCLAKSSSKAFLLGFKNTFFLQGLYISSMAETILVQAQDPAKVSMEIQNAINGNKLDYSWKLLEQHKHMEGFPRKSLFNKIITSYVESLDMQWLQKAYELVQRASEDGKKDLLEKELLIYLSIGLAKVRLPVLASTILRKMIDMEHFPPVTAWSAVLAHMSQTADGSFLAAELILEIGYLFQYNRVDPRKKSNAPLIAMKPNANAFNIALAGCLVFEKSRKAEQLLDMMPRIGVKADANLLITMARVYERNGRREELMKLQRHIEEASNLTDIQFRQFYNCLLTCHLKFGDLDSASNMVLEMLKKAKEARNSLASAKFMIDAAKIDQNYSPRSASVHILSNSKDLESVKNDQLIRNTALSYEEFSKDRNFLKLEMESKAVLGSLFAKLQMQVDLITTVHGILQPTETIYVKLVKYFLEAGKTKDLAVFLLKAEREDSPFSNDNSALVHVINSCISLGWLDQAHDLLDEMRLAGVRTGSSVYASLLKAYCAANRAADVTSLLRDARKAGIQLGSSSYEAMIQSRVLQEDTQGALQLFKEMKEARIPKVSHQYSGMLTKSVTETDEAALVTKLVQEIKEGQKVDCGVHDWNNVIHFFCKKRLMQDAEKALKKMRSLGHSPNAQTFHSMVTGYAAVGGKYLEVTELWGEMKALASSSSMKFDQELLDSVLYTFVRGGFFTRANEVVAMMEKGKMFIDKYKYRMLFLKYHKTLYKGKAPKFQTESQLNKREAALAFKRWIGLV